MDDEPDIPSQHVRSLDPVSRVSGLDPDQLPSATLAQGAVGWLGKRRLRHLTQTFGASVVIQLFLFASGLTIARRLGPTGRGEVTIVLALPPVVMQLVCIGFPSALTYYVARHQEAWMTLGRRVWKAALCQTIAGLLILFALDASFLAGKSASAVAAGVVATFSLPLLIFLYYTVHLVQGLGAIRWFNVLRIGSVALYSGGIFAASLFGLTVVRCALVWTGSQALLATIAVIDLVKRARRASRGPQSAVPTSRTIGQFAMAGFLAQISPIESFRLDVLAVAALFPSSVVGYYSVANSVTNAPLFTADALVAVGYPHIAAQDGRDAIASAKRYVKGGGVLCGLVAVALAAVLPLLIPLLFGRTYLPSVGTAELLACAAAVMGVRRIGNDCLRAIGKPALATKLEVITLVVLAVGLAILGPVGDGRGVAISLITSAAIGLALFWRLLRRLEAVANAASPGADGVH